MYKEKVLEKFNQLQGGNQFNTVTSIDKYIEEITTAIASCLHYSCPTIKSRQGLIKISRGLLEKIKLKRDIQAIPRLGTTKARIPQHHKGNKNQNQTRRRKKGCLNETGQGPEPQGQSTILENNQQSHWTNKIREETNKTHQPINQHQNQLRERNCQHLCHATGQGPQNSL